MLPSIKKAASNSKSKTPNFAAKKGNEKLPKIKSKKSVAISSSENSTIEDSDDSDDSDDSYVTDISDDEQLDFTRRASTNQRGSILNGKGAKNSFKNSTKPEATSNKKESIKFETNDEEENSGSPFKYERKYRKSLGKVVTFKAEKKPYYLSPFYKKEFEIRDVDMNKFLSLISRSKWHEASNLCRKFVKTQPSNKILREFLMLLQSLIIINDNLKTFSRRTNVVESKKEGKTPKLTKDKSRLSEVKSNARSLAESIKVEEENPVQNLTNEEKLTVLENALDSLINEASMNKTLNEVMSSSKQQQSATELKTITESPAETTLPPLPPMTNTEVDNNETKLVEPVEKKDEENISQLIDEFYGLK